MSDPEVKIVLTIDGKQYEASLKTAKENLDNLGDVAKQSGETAAKGMDKAVKATMTWQQFIKGRMGPLMKKFAAEGKANGEAHTLAIRQIAKEWKEYKKTGVAANTAVTQKTKKSSQAVKGLAANVNHLKGTVKLLTGAFLTWQVARVVSELKETALQAEALGNKLRFATGSSEGAAEAMAFVREESNRLGLELLSQGDAYASIAAASKGSQLEGAATREIYLGVAEASAALSLSTDQSRGAMRALEQIMSKGTVQAEELRGQLGERIPGAFQIAARAMNVTTSELNKMLELGQVLAVDFLPKFSAELRKTFGEDAVKNADSARASFNRLDTAFFELKSTLGEGLNETLSDTADWLTTLINKTNELVGGGGGGNAGLNGWERQIADIGQRLKEAEAELLTEKQDRTTVADLFFGTTFEERVKKAQDKIAALKQAMVAVNRQYNQFGDFSQQNSPVTEPTKTPKVDSSIAKSGDNLQQKLERQIALYGLVGEAAKVRYETERGSLAGLKPEQKEKLLDLADELEFIKANDQAVRDAIATQNDAIAADQQLAAAKQEIINANLQSIGLNSAAEADAEGQRYQMALEQLQIAEDAKLNTLIGYDELRVRLKAEHESRLTSITQQGLSDREKFEQLSATNKSKTVLGFMSGILGSAARHNKKLFKINQIVGVANATISMYEGVMKAWAMGPILGPILAPIVAAAGLVNIRAIKNASFGGGGAVGTYSASPSTGLANADPFARSASAGGQSVRSSAGSGVTYINYVGNKNDTLNGEQVEQMFDAFEEASERGDRVFFTRNSRQGLELREDAA